MIENLKREKSHQTIKNIVDVTSPIPISTPTRSLHYKPQREKLFSSELFNSCFQTSPEQQCTPDQTFYAEEKLEHKHKKIMQISHCPLCYSINYQLQI